MLSVRCTGCVQSLSLHGLGDGTDESAHMHSPRHALAVLIMGIVELSTWPGLCLEPCDQRLAAATYWLHDGSPGLLCPGK